MTTAMERKIRSRFHKGQKVLWLSHGYSYGIHLTEGEVTLITNKDGAPVVYARHIDRNGNEWKRKFSPIAGMFQENPYPIWQLRPLDGDDVSALHKRAEHATKLRNNHEAAYQDMQRQVHNEAMQWEREEVEKRIKLIPHGQQYINRVIARMGFKRPATIKVRVNGKTTTTRG